MIWPVCACVPVPVPVCSYGTQDAYQSVSAWRAEATSSLYRRLCYARLFFSVRTKSSFFFVLFVGILSSGLRSVSHSC